MIVIESLVQRRTEGKCKAHSQGRDKAVKENFELTTEDKKEYKFDAKLTKGETTLTIVYTNDAYKENEYDRNLFLHGVRVEKK